LTIKFAPPEILSGSRLSELFLALTCLDFFYPSLSDCQRSVPANAGNQKLISEPLVSGTESDSRELRAFSCLPTTRLFFGVQIQRLRFRHNCRRPYFSEVADPGFN